MVYKMPEMTILEDSQGKKSQIDIRNPCCAIWANKSNHLLAINHNKQKETNFVNKSIIF